MGNLSKSRYTLYRQCPRALWLKTYMPDEAEKDPGLEKRFEEGTRIGRLAQGLFGGFTDVTAHKEDGGLDLAAMIARTRQCMADGTENICEASFSAGGCFCSVDILRRTAGGYALYEVKSSTFSPSSGDMGKLERYAPDIAFQKWVLEQCGVKVTQANLVCLNADYVRGEDLDVRALFAVIPMDAFIAEEYALVPENVPLAQKLLDLAEEPQCALAACCSAPYHCAFWQHCARILPEHSVFDLYRMGFSDKLAAWGRGIATFEDALGSLKLTPVQRMQAECTLNRSSHVDRQGIAAFLDGLRYPLYYLDFETMMPAVPPFRGTSPYQQIPFQYSLHIVRKEGAEPEHREFLGESGTDTRRPLAERLCADIPQGACVIAYNKAFECSRLEELAQAFPDLAAHLRSIKGNILDLLDPFKAGYCYVPAMGRSFSIKSVLPALFPGDPELDYHALGMVQNGGEAMDIFPRIASMPQEEAQKAREALLQYCRLDTWAMVRVLEKLREMC